MSAKSLVLNIVTWKQCTHMWMKHVKYIYYQKKVVYWINKPIQCFGVFVNKAMINGVRTTLAFSTENKSRSKRGNISIKKSSNGTETNSGTANVFFLWQMKSNCQLLFQFPFFFLHIKATKSILFALLFSGTLFNCAKDKPNIGATLFQPFPLKLCSQCQSFMSVL